MKKLMIAALVFGMGSIASAATLNCLVKEGTGVDTVTEFVVQHEINGQAHSMTPFETPFSTGFVAVSHNQAVVSIVLKGIDQPFSFHGSVKDGGVVGGTAYTPDRSVWITLLCQK